MSEFELETAKAKELGLIKSDNDASEKEEAPAKAEAPANAEAQAKEAEAPKEDSTQKSTDTADNKTESQDKGGVTPAAH